MASKICLCSFFCVHELEWKFSACMVPVVVNCDNIATSISECKIWEGYSIAAIGSCEPQKTTQ